MITLRRASSLYVRIVIILPLTDCGVWTTMRKPDAQARSTSFNFAPSGNEGIRDGNVVIDGWWLTFGRLQLP